MQPSQHFASEGNLGAGGRLGRRVIVSALLGAGIGFSLGVAFHAMWQLLMRIYSGSPESARTGELRDELLSLRSEFMELRRSLAPMQKSSHDEMPEGFPSFYVSDDDGDEFFEIANGDSSPDNYFSAGSGDLLNSEPTSFHSLSGVSGSKHVRPHFGPALPREVADELDQLADFAMGNSTDIPSSLKVGAGGDESRLGSQAYARCLVYRAKYRRSPDFLWRFARGIYLVCAESPSEENTFVTVNDLDVQSTSTSVSSRTFIPNDLNDLAYYRTNKRQFIEAGLALARKSLVLAKLCHEQPDYSFETRSMAEVYKWLAVMVGLASEFGGMQQRISYGYEFKELVDKALEHNPDDEHCCYLMGRWCYQVYNLTWVERQFASRLFATLPTATLEEAMSYFDKVERLRPDFYAANHLYVAKCHISAGNYKEAASWLSKAKQLVEQHRIPPPHLDSLEIRTEIVKLADQYSTYC